MPNENKIIVSKKEGLMSNGCYVSSMNWMKDIVKFPLDCVARVRYNSQGTDAVLINQNKKMFCEFKSPQLAVTPGQSIVFYNKETIIGGGIIE